MTENIWRLDSSVVDARHLSEEASKPLDTITKARSLTKQRSCVFNQLPQSRMKRAFGRRNAFSPRAEGKPLSKEHRGGIDEAASISEICDEKSF